MQSTEKFYFISLDLNCEIIFPTHGGDSNVTLQYYIIPLSFKQIFGSIRVISIPIFVHFTNNGIKKVRRFYSEASHFHLKWVLDLLNKWKNKYMNVHTHILFH